MASTFSTPHLTGGTMNCWTKKIIDSWTDSNSQRLVRINSRALHGLAKDLADCELEVPTWQLPGVFPKCNSAFMSHLIYECAIDFCFTDPRRPAERFRVGEYTGSLAMARCFYRHFGESTLWWPDKILEITASDASLRHFFRGDTEIPLLEERGKNLREVTKGMDFWFGNNPRKLFEAANYRVFPTQGSAGLLLTLESCFPESFAGDADGLGFRKRSQLLALVYQGRAIHSNDELPLLKDADQIGPIADCAVPNALREMKILEYSPKLEEKIRRREEISFRGQEETQIRTATVVAVSQLLERVNYLRSYNGEPKISMLELDNYLWSAGRQSALPYHITQTTAY